MYILVVEDDHLQYDPIQDSLKQAFPDAKVDRISTESQFRLFIDSEQAGLPDLVVLDVMLAWAVPSENMPEPPQAVIEGGYYRAGFRCEQLLAQHERTKGIPAILYTVLERDDLEKDLGAVRPNTVYLRKTPDPEDLFRLINSLASMAAR